MNKMLKLILLGVTAISFTACTASNNVENKSFYKSVKQYKKGNLKKEGRVATNKEVKEALKDKSKLVIDFRGEGEKIAAKIPNSHEVSAHHFTKGMDDIVKKENLKSIDSVYVICRTASRGAYQTMAWDKLMSEMNLNIPMKVVSLKTWAEGCNPLESLDDEVKGAHLYAKKVFLKQAKDGLYYSDNCLTKDGELNKK